MTQIKKLVLITLASLFVTSQATAKPARCFTTTDGYYNCDFRAVGGDGSFIISAPGIPTFTLQMSEPGVAYGFARFNGGRNVSLPGQYFRSSQDRACWINDSTNTKICAW
ncbi:hypothetical protein MNBD_ALPHA08-2370 [hydrothermal vent metagenome]|uniref:Uncharacterized protein n=1 Tax=hydrothermal vent metagenome TaxID=652676 RepID=A0A3B0S4F1_9ZZZZ